VAYDLTGKIKLIQEEKKFDSGFAKREMVVIVEDGKYPQEINIEFVQDKIALLENLQEGQEVTVTFDIRGREYNGRYFNNLQGWKVVTLGNEAANPQGEQAQEPPYPTPADFQDDDIPF
jgi:single-stranded DNA-binding protein